MNGRAWAAAIGMIAMIGALAGCRTSPPPPRNYLVFFPFDSADLSPEARQVVDQAAAGAKAMKASTVAIAGFADRVGTPSYNQHLSERRVAAVEQALTADGVAPGRFLRIPLGEAEAGIEGTGGRRVEIRLTPAPGS